MPQWNVKEVPDLSGKIVIVTGGNSGLGFYCCKVMLEKNAKVYVASRDSKKSHDAIEQLKKETGKEPILLPLDLSDLHSVRKCAKEFLSKESKLDILMNNAGVMAVPIDRLTVDGYDLQFGTNVLGHFHLTTLLLPTLLSHPGSRIINVSSEGHRYPFPTGIQFDTLKGPKTGSWFPPSALLERYQYYGQSKLGNILFSNELARRFQDKGLISIAIHPGVISTDLTRYHSSFLSKPLSYVIKPVEVGAITQLFAATSPEAAELSGKYLIPQAQVGKPSVLSQNEELAKKMWDWCEQELKAF